MKIKLSTIYASPHLTAQPGSVIDVSDVEGKELVAGRFGVEVADGKPAAPEAETASTAAPENAARRTGRGKPRTPAAPEVE